MNGRSLLLTVCALSAILLLAPTITTAQTIWLYGQVKVGSNYTDGILVTLAGGSVAGSPTNYTYENVTGHGYYQFLIPNGSSGNYVVSANYYNTTYSKSLVLNSGTVVGHFSDISIPATAPTAIPSPTIIATPTPRPLNDIGGMVTRTNQTSYIPMSATNPSSTPLPMWTPTAAPSIYPSVTPTPTPVPSSGIFSNIRLWLMGTVAAIIVIIVAAAAVLLYIRRY